jgi:YidC/Oxa1 family membrane protein insertase
MDIQRSILIVALAIVSYLMVLQWNQDYGQAALPTTGTSAITAQATLPDDTASAKTSDDVPTATTAERNEPAVAQVAPSSDLIRVETDVLNLAIDPNGGDIVQLTLPKYPRRQDRPDVPFQLFDNGGERLYQAQSGLVGANGPDARANGRPLYSATQRSYTLADGQEQLVVDLTFSEAGVNYTKRFTLTRGKYELQVSYKFDRQHVRPAET